MAPRRVGINYKPLNWDYIIVGGGSAGCVLANRLSQNPNNKVLVLEAGGDDWAPDTHVPALVSGVRRYNWKYEAVPDPSRYEAVDHCSAGKVLGGSSSINGMMFVRGHKMDFDNWDKLGCPGWDYASILPSFKAIELFEGGPDEYRGGNGPQSVSFSRAYSPITDRFIEAAQSAGYPYNPDYNGQIQEGVARIQVNQTRGRRSSAARAFLAPVRTRLNVHVRTRSQVLRIIFQGRRAVGVEFRHRGHIELAQCRGEIVLSAGAIGSPKILMLSGVGAGDHLREYGISVLADLQGVGVNLMEHPAIWTQARVTCPSFNAEMRPFRHLINGLNWLLFGRGPASAGVCQAQIFASTRSGLTAPNMQLIFTPVIWENDLVSKAVRICRYNGISIAALVLTPKGRGRVRLSSANADDSPVVDHDLLGEEDDFAQLVEGVEKVISLLQTPPLSSIVQEITLPKSVSGLRKELADDIRRYAFRGDHAVGTCRMGMDEAAVVDPRLRVHGLERLRVVDASVMPVITRGNTYAPVLMIGQKASEMILQDQRTL